MKNQLISIFERVRSEIDRKLGRCPRCMRWSLRGTVLGWIGVLIASQLYNALWIYLLPVPVTFTGLWLMHLARFGTRFVKSEVAETGSLVKMISRRTMLRFIYGAGIAVTVSAMLPRITAAQTCDAGYHLCADRKHCCKDGSNYACPYDTCNKEGGKCLTLKTDEDFKYYQQCCPGLFSC